MNTVQPLGDSDGADAMESAADRRRRLAREAVMLAEARASAAAGRVVEEAEVDAWIDSLGTDDELPPPYSRR